MVDVAGDAGALLPLELHLDLVDDVQRVADARRHLAAAERTLAVDLAWARALHGVSVAQLAGATGLQRRRVKRLMRMSAV